MNNFTIIILTYNEENNLPSLLRSIEGIDANIFIVDSYSVDKTIEIIKEAGIVYAQNPFENYSVQRNWAQNNCPFNTEWVLHLDAGEQVSEELKDWLMNKFDPEDGVDGYMFSRRTIFYNKWIKRGGHYPNYHLRLYKKDKGRCELKVYDQHFVVDGVKNKIGNKADIIDTVTDTLQNFTNAHAKWAIFEAIEIVASSEEKGDVQPKLFGNPIERRRWMKTKIFQKAPLFVRAFLYFNYRYFIKLGILDGKWGLVFHFLQGFWFRFLVDSNVLEIRHGVQSVGDLSTFVEKAYGEKYLKILKK